MFSNLAWLWAIPGIGVAIGAFFLIRRFGGNIKTALLGAAAVIGVTALKVITAGAYKRGSEEAREKQRLKNEEDIRRAEAARERAKAKERLNPGVIDEKDPNLRD